MISTSMRCRSRFSCSSRSANRCASVGLSVVNNRTANIASSNRPAALIRGAKRKRSFPLCNPASPSPPASALELRNARHVTTEPIPRVQILDFHPAMGQRRQPSPVPRGRATTPTAPRRLRSEAGKPVPPYRLARRNRVPEGHRASSSMGIQHRHSQRHVLVCLVMVRHHHIHSETGRQCNFFMRGCAAIGCHQQRDTLVMQALHGAKIQPIAFWRRCGTYARTYAPKPPKNDR